MQKDNILWAIMLLAALPGCDSRLPILPKGRAIHGIAAPFRLTGDSATIFLEDFVPGPGNVDSVFIAGREAEIRDDRVEYSPERGEGYYVPIDLWSRGSCYTVIGRRTAAGSRQSADSGMPGTQIFTRDIEGRTIVLGVDGVADHLIVLWNNFRLDDKFLDIDEDEIVISIPREAAEDERSYIRVFAEGADGPFNEVIVPLHYGRVLLDADSLNRKDLHRSIIYNVFIDRFFDGDTGNNRPLNRPDVHPRVDYHGGDLAGLIRQLKGGYFDSLGVNTLWISPVVLNPAGPYGQWPEPPTKFSAYHGYWPISFTRIDSHYGSPEELSELTSTAHARNMNVLLDYVAHHVHQEHPYYREHPTWVTPLYLPDGTKNTEKWDEHRLTTWFDDFLPTLDLQQTELTEMLTDSAVWWISTYDLDGFRHDATKHIPEQFQRRLTIKLKDLVPSGEAAPYQIGETYGSPELISSYVGPGLLDGQFDFNVYDAATNAIGKEAVPFTRLDEVLHQSFSWYGNHNLMGYITGNQDRARFISYAGGSLDWDENAKQTGWDREIGVGDPVGYDRLRMLTAFIMTIPGIPVIYYGDEIGMPGGNDPDSRRMMRFGKLAPEEEETMQTTKYLAALRKDRLALVYGDLTTLIASEQVYAYQRQYFNDMVIVAFNKGREESSLAFSLPPSSKNAVLTGSFGHPFSQEGGEVIIHLPPASFEILTSNLKSK
jgi:glycosidase